MPTALLLLLCPTVVLLSARAMQAPEGSFGSAIYVPTPEGFSNAPGCVESYAATARFRLYTKGDKVEGDGLTRPLVLREEEEFKASATTCETLHMVNSFRVTSLLY